MYPENNVPKKKATAPVPSALSNTLAIIPAGITATFLVFWLENLKRRQQSGLPINPLAIGLSGCYKGVLSSLGGFLPGIAVQEGSANVLQTLFPPNKNIESVIQEATAGAIGSVVISATETLIYYQQITNCTLRTAVSQLYARGPSIFFRTIPLIMPREVGFTLCFRNSNEVNQQFTCYFDSKIAGVGVQFGVGILAAALTQPCDTAATLVLQKTFATVEKKPARKILTTLYSQYGARHFFKGLGFRVGVFSSYTCIISYGKEFFSHLIEPWVNPQLPELSPKSINTPK